MLTFHQFQVWVSEAIEKPYDLVCGEMGYPLAVSSEDMEKITKIVFACANNDLQQILKIAGKTQRSVSYNYNIPVNTINNWCMQRHQAPEYTTALLAYSLLTDIIDWENPEFCCE